MALLNTENTQLYRKGTSLDNLLSHHVIQYKISIYSLYIYRTHKSCYREVGQLTWVGPLSVGLSASSSSVGPRGRATPVVRRTHRSSRSGNTAISVGVAAIAATACAL